MKPERTTSQIESRRWHVIVLAAILGGLIGAFLGVLAVGFSGNADPDQWWRVLFGFLAHRLVANFAAVGAIVAALIAAWAIPSKAK